jgi:hypothetical protein
MLQVESAWSESGKLSQLGEAKLHEIILGILQFVSRSEPEVVSENPRFGIKKVARPT